MFGSVRAPWLGKLVFEIWNLNPILLNSLLGVEGGRNIPYYSGQSPTPNLSDTRARGVVLAPNIALLLGGGCGAHDHFIDRRG